MRGVNRIKRSWGMEHGGCRLEAEGKSEQKPRTLKWGALAIAWDYRDGLNRLSIMR